MSRTTFTRRTGLLGVLGLMACAAAAQVPASPEAERLVSAVRYVEIYQAQNRWMLAKAPKPRSDDERKFHAVLARTVSVPAEALKPAFVSVFSAALRDDEARAVAEFFESPAGRKVAATSVALYAQLDGNPSLARDHLQLTQDDQANYLEVSRTPAFARYTTLVTNKDFARDLVRRIVALPAFADLNLAGTF
jgi:hypothetical protein